MEGLSGQTILEQFRQREKEIKAEADRLDKEMDKRRREQERIQADALLKLTAARAALAAMKHDYVKMESELEGKARADLEVSAITADKVKAGAVTLREFMAHGLSDEAVKRQAHEDVAGKLVEAQRLILEKQTEIFELELVEAQARKESIFAATYPGQTQIKKLKAETEMLERSIGEIFGGYYLADADVERAKNSISLCQEKTIGGLTWDSLSYDELRDLRFDPRIRDHKNFKAVEELEKIIADADPQGRYYLVMSCGGWGRDPGFIVRRLDSEDGMITTTTTSAPAKAIK